MDKFELAGFDEETCERLRKISHESGIEPETLINFAWQYQADPHTLSEYAQCGIAWEVFKQALWNKFSKSKIGKFMFLVADKMAALLERSGKQ